MLVKALIVAALAIPLVAKAAPLTGAAAYGDWRTDAPGTIRHLTPDDLPAPYASQSSSNTPSVAASRAGALPKVPQGFSVQRFAGGLQNPRLLRVAPNGDIFVAETAAGRIRVLRAAPGTVAPTRNEVFATNLDTPFGMAFYPPGPDPRYLYVATLNAVLRYPYHPGDLRAAGPPETVIPRLTGPAGGHITRDIQFTPDGRQLLVSVGSASNVAQGLPPQSAAEAAAWDESHGMGAAYGPETNRADVLAFDPDGQGGHVYATGIRNCVGLAIQPATATARPGAAIVWCATNERDGLGDNLPPDYVTSVQERAFYGWPWYYIGAHEDPRHKNERPDLAAHVTTPDILLQPHSAPLQLTFYPSSKGPAAFPASYAGDAFVALHGSWNRGRRTGYKVVRLRFQNGVPTGDYEDFLTGFVLDDDTVWGRPVGVAVAQDGALLVTEDANDTIWRIAYSGPR